MYNKPRLHTAINRADFVSWCMLYTHQGNKMHSWENGRCTFVGESLNRIHQDTKSVRLIAACACKRSSTCDLIQNASTQLHWPPCFIHRVIYGTSVIGCVNYRIALAPQHLCDKVQILAIACVKIKLVWSVRFLLHAIKITWDYIKFKRFYICTLNSAVLFQFQFHSDRFSACKYKPQKWTWLWLSEFSVIMSYSVL